jgi:hypothetical protein
MFYDGILSRLTTVLPLIVLLPDVILPHLGGLRNQYWPI